MAKKFRRVRTFARTAAKSMEKKLVENAKELSEDPYIILPEYSDNFSKKLTKGYSPIAALSLSIFAT